MKIAANLMEALITIFFVIALLPVAVNGILTANLSGVYKTLFSVLAIAVVGGIVFGIYKMVMHTHKGR